MSGKRYLSALTLTLSLLALAVAPRQVHAHADVVTAVPAVGSTVTEAPKEIRIEFDERLVAIGTSIKLFDAKGAAIALPKGTIDAANPKVFVVALPAVLTDGAYTVRWVAVAEDGHAERGSYRFKVALAQTGQSSGLQAGQPQKFTLRFVLKAGDAVAACGQPIKALGSKRTDAQIVDARMLVSNVRLVDGKGVQTPAKLIADGRWQSDKAALIDFENATGACREGGTAETNTVIKIEAPAGVYRGVAFDVGVPYEINHADVATAKAPLNVKAMWWNWQFGYKFARFDFKTNAPAPNNNFLVHLGSTGCGKMADKTGHGSMGAMNKPPAEPCANPNVLRVKLDRFDPATSQIVADLNGLFRGVNLAQPSPEPAGCMSGIQDSDCSPLMANMGLDIKTGTCAENCAKQAFFRLDVAEK
jgi:uncharacterized repeat protein (TIGR04052 family)